MNERIIVSLVAIVGSLVLVVSGLRSRVTMRTGLWMAAVWFVIIVVGVLIIRAWDGQLA